ncbi:MAG: ferredoxin [Mesorhizobium sp.]|nr:ferredoxin [Mesorhizobium sp.]
MRIRLDLDKCIGAGQCVTAAPDVFAQDDDMGLVQFVDGQPSPAQRDRVLAAIRLCPARAIIDDDIPSADTPAGR